MNLLPLNTKQNLWEKSKPVNAALLSAQSVDGAFAIVKAARRKDLEIIKEREICSEKKFFENQGISHFQAHRKNYQGDNFYEPAYNFHGHIG